MSWIRSIIGGMRGTPVPETAKLDTHDFSKGCWGHRVEIMRVIDRGQQLKVAGWGYGVKLWDYIILANGKDTTRYQVKDVNYCHDPRDMWFGMLQFSPREEKK